MKKIIYAAIAILAFIVSAYFIVWLVINQDWPAMSFGWAHVLIYSAAAIFSVVFLCVSVLAVVFFISDYRSDLEDERARQKSEEASAKYGYLIDTKGYLIEINGCVEFIQDDKSVLIPDELIFDLGNMCFDFHLRNKKIPCRISKISWGDGKIYYRVSLDTNQRYPFNVVYKGFSDVVFKSQELGEFFMQIEDAYMYNVGDAVSIGFSKKCDHGLCISTIVERQS